MDTATSGFQHSHFDKQQLLLDNEVIVLVDDDAFIREPIKMYFAEHGIPLLEADSGESFWHIMSHNNAAMVLLDIGLPDIDGKTLPPLIKKQYPDAAILMLSGVSDINTAMECIRAGADDYLSKPSPLADIYLAVKKLLEKRRLLIQNRQYQEELEYANFRLQLMHELSLKMNSVYLDTVKLDEILLAILVGITAYEGLRFNRAFLAMIEIDDDVLRGRMAIGPGCREEANKIWQDLNQKGFNFFDIIQEVKACAHNQTSEVNQLIQQLQIPLNDVDHILIRCAIERQTIKVTNGMAQGFDPTDVVNLLGTRDFVVVPLYSPRRPLGVIIADNLITGRPIANSYISALELFSSQASLIIEHSRLYMKMEETIAKLEAVNYELDKNKDMLVEAERYSALGHMAAQMAHNIRNPITAIGGVARILSRKTNHDNINKYIDVMVKETERIESTLKNLFEFVESETIHPETVQIHPLLRKALNLLQPEIDRYNIKVVLDCADQETVLNADSVKIRKALVHIFKNAIDAMVDGGTLTIKTSIDTSCFKLLITNTGNRIEATLANKAKEPFFTTKVYGTGMGLSIVERIINAHGGTFTISRGDVNTEVMVQLPLPSQQSS